MEQSVLISVGLPIAIGVIMCGIGLHLTPADFRRVTEFPRSVLVGVAGHYLLLPALGFATAWLFRLPPELAIGLVLVAACPSGNMANTLTFLARGNVALAVCLSVISALASFVSIPVLVALASEAFAGEARSVRVPLLETAKHLAGILLIPIVTGMLVRARLPCSRGSAAARSCCWPGSSSVSRSRSARPWPRRRSRPARRRSRCAVRRWPAATRWDA